jgi:asparagine synthetase B (glutamine-hydrolysing)
MCGICGKYSTSGVKSGDLHAMLSTIVHRGPDDSGCYVMLTSALAVAG